MSLFCIIYLFDILETGCGRKNTRKERRNKRKKGRKELFTTGELPVLYIQLRICSGAILKKSMPLQNVL